MKILNSIIKFGKAFSALTSVGKYAALGAMIFIAFSVGNCNSEDKFEQFKLEYVEYKKSADNAVKYGDSLRKEVIVLDNELKQKDVVIKTLTVSINAQNKERTKLKNALSGMEKNLDSLKASTDSLAIISAQDDIITNLNTQVAIADTIIIKKDSVIDTQNEKLALTENQKKLYKMESDSLRTILSNLPKPPTNPNKVFGVINKPTRTTVGIIAFVTGVVVGTQLTR